MIKKIHTCECGFVTNNFKEWSNHVETCDYPQFDDPDEFEGLGEIRSK